MHFAYIKVPHHSLPGQAFDALHYALEQELTAAGVGELISWGTSLPSARARESDPGSFHRVDVELRQLATGLDLLREALLKVGVPHGTELHYTVQGATRQQTLTEGGWGAEVQSTGAPRPRSNGSKR